MPVIESRINSRSQAFIDNARALQEQVDDLRAKMLSAAKCGSESARAKHLARGKLLPRARVERLLDPGTPFLKLPPLPGSSKDHTFNFQQLIRISISVFVWNITHTMT